MVMWVTAAWAGGGQELVDAFLRATNGDADGAALDTPLSLEGLPDPTAPTLPNGLRTTLEALTGAKPDPGLLCVPEFADCIAVTRRAQGSTLRPVRVEGRGSRLRIEVFLEKGGQPQGQSWLTFVEVDGGWWLAGAGDRPTGP